MKFPSIFKKSSSENINAKNVIFVDYLSELTREGINKAYMPKFLYKPPFGYPRFVDIAYIRYLAQTPYVEMTIKTILDELSSVEWDIVPTPGFEKEKQDEELERIKAFFNNPNTNHETFEEVFIRKCMRDELELNSGVLNKVYNMKQELVEIVARDAGTFTVNPDIHGMFTDREDILLPSQIVPMGQQIINPMMQVNEVVAREKAAYFQYGWISGPIPVPFGKKEIIWLSTNPRTDDYYGYSALQILAKSLQALLYMIESDLEYFNDNNVPKGIIGLDGSDADEIKAFKQQWFEVQRTKDEFGNWKKVFHRVPIVNKVPQFTRIEFSAQELEIIEKQKWYAKLVWASFGVTPTELGYSEEAQGQSNQIVQSKVFRKKAINPRLRLMEKKFTNEIISEFGYIVKRGNVAIPKYQFKFKTFDIDEERSKAELYKVQIEMGYKTINEIRAQEGLNEVEWGNEPLKKLSFAGEGFNPFESQNQDKPFNQSEKEKEIDKEGRDSLEDIPRKKEEEKALTTESDLTPKEFEEVYARNLKKLLRLKEERIKELLSETMREDILKQIKAVESKPFAGYSNFKECVSKNQDKNDPEAYCAAIMHKIEGKSVDDLFKFIAAVLGIEEFRELSNEAIKSNYYKGWENAEVELNRNLKASEEALRFLQDYTFKNIIGMNESLVNSLRQVLQRAIINNETLSQIKSKITEVFDTHESRAEAIARTEMNRALNQGRLQAMRSAKEEKMTKTWTAHLDERTSALCRRMHSQTVGINEKFKDKETGEEFDSTPGHVNCRSTITYSMS